MKKFGVFKFEKTDPHCFQHQDICLEGLSAHTSIQALHLAYCPGLACKIFQALRSNTSVKCLRIDVEFEDDVTKEFVGLLSSNKSIQEIEVKSDANSSYTVTNRDAFIAMMEEVANAKHLKKIGIWYPWYNFDYTASIGQAVCKVIRDNDTLRSLKIPLLLPQDESFLQPIAETLCKNATLQTLIFKSAVYYSSETASHRPHAFITEEDETFGVIVKLNVFIKNLTAKDSPSCRAALSIEESEALHEMLKKNKSLQIVHLPAHLSDQYMPFDYQRIVS